MAIYTPGIRDRHQRTRRKGSRNVVAVLSLTAMVDMFTVLAVFLLQNFQVEEIEFKDNIEMPEAQAVKKLLKSRVVSVSKDDIIVDKYRVALMKDVQAQDSWMIDDLYTKTQELIEEARTKVRAELGVRIREAMMDDERATQIEQELEKEVTRITVQADKEIDFLSLKKVLFTITEAGAAEINFAVFERKKRNLPQEPEL
jgi:biopolymer transport protein ExbD